MIILDTDVLLEIFDRRSHKGEKALESIKESGEGISITSINLHEILYGLEKYAKPVKEVLQLPVVNYTKNDASLSAKIELDAEYRGMSIRRTDTMIAAMTINNAASLYTFDSHFQSLKSFGLKLFK